MNWTEIILIISGCGLILAVFAVLGASIRTAQEENNSIIADAMTWRLTGPVCQGEGVWTFPAPMPAGRKRPPVISLYEALDYLADRFIDSGHRALLGITFERYLAAPDVYDAQADALRSGHGVNTVAGSARIVPLKRRKAAALR